MRATDTRKVLIEEGLKALLANGYDGIGIGPILAKAGVPKGSFYYFFRSKEEFACAVLDAYAEKYRRLLEGILVDTSKPPLQRLHAYFGQLERDLAEETPLGGCLYGVVAQTMATRNTVLRDKLHQCFTTWEANLRQVLREARDAGDLAPGVHPDEAAAFLIDAYEGALIRMKSDDSFEPLRRFKTLALARLFDTAEKAGSKTSKRR